MSVNIGPKPIVNDGLLLNYDASNPINYTLSEVEVLVVAGGGGGGAYAAGAGGGAGGVVYNTNYAVTPGSAISVTVGNGGNGGVWSSPSPQNGQNSLFGKLTAIGGGAGGQGWGGNPGGSGGSGGGGAGYDGVSTQNYISGGGATPGQGFPGGRGKGISGNRGAGGGGGGAGGPGGDATNFGAGNGGRGLPFNISGVMRYYGGGGGGGDYGSAGGGNGGSGGGGTQSGGNSSNQTATNGAPNSGGGGGGSRSATPDSWNGGNGGSGVVIVRYPGPRKANGGNTITSTNGYTIHTFTSSGTFTPFSTPTNATTIYGLHDLSPYNNHAYTDGTVTYYTDGGGSVSGNGTSGSGSIVSSIMYGSDGNRPKVYSFSQKGITFEVWFKTSASDPHEGVYSGIIDWNDSTLSLGTYTPNAFPNQFRSWINNGGSRTTEFTVDSNVANYYNTWHHVVLSYNYTLSVVNGYWDNTLTFTQNKGGLLETPMHPFVIGDREIPGFGYSFGGRIAIARVYDRGLTSDEVSQNFNAHRGRFGR